jgi:hypothetical protein
MKPTIAADMALHFWYSTFLPDEYQLQLSTIVQSFLQLQAQSGTITLPLGPRSRLSATFPKAVTEFFMHFISSSLPIGDQGDRVRNMPLRRDFRDRMYESLQPSHRVAFVHYRRFGVVLPFGAMTAHFNRLNLSLFSPGGRWLQPDSADPLDGWE